MCLISFWVLFVCFFYFLQHNKISMSIKNVITKMQCTFFFIVQSYISLYSSYYKEWVDITQWKSSSHPSKQHHFTSWGRSYTLAGVLRAVFRQQCSSEQYQDCYTRSNILYTRLFINEGYFSSFSNLLSPWPLFCVYACMMSRAFSQRPFTSLLVIVSAQADIACLASTNYILD